jgi:PD-(D/E)XK nuclease superfamily
LIPDLIVDQKVIVDPKVVAAFNEAHVAQMIGYLTITGLELALLLNFKSARLEWKRVVQQQSPESSAPDLRNLNLLHSRHPRNPRFLLCRRGFLGFKKLSKKAKKKLASP